MKSILGYLTITKVFLITIFLSFVYSEESCSVDKSTGVGSCAANQAQDPYVQIPKEEEFFSPLDEVRSSITAEETEKLDITYRELFDKHGDEVEKLKKGFEAGSNYTDYYDFSIDKDELDSLVEPRSSLYPPKKFEANNQGNYLHFYKTAFEQKLPVVFTTDAFLEGFTKTYHRMTKIFFEEVLIHYIRKFSDSMVAFIRKNKDTEAFKSVRFNLDSVQAFYSIVSSLVTKGMEEFTPDKDIEAEFNRWKKIVESYNTDGEIFFLGKKKRVNYNLVYARGYWRNSQRLSNIWSSLAFLMAHRFHIESDIKGVWIMGKLVHDAGMSEHFRSLSLMVKYFIGQDSILMSVVEIAKIGIEEGNLKDYLLSDKDIKYLIEIGKTKKNKLSLTFLDQMIMWSKEQLEQISVEREKTTHFLNPEYSIVDWLVNKFTDYREDHDRRIVSYYEINQAVTLNKVYKNLIKNRMKGIKTTRSEVVIELRDKVDYNETLAAVDTVMNNAFAIEEDGWRANTMNHFYMLLQRANKQSNDTLATDKIYSSKEFQKKNYHLGASAATVFKNQFKVHSRYMKSKITEGEIPEVWVESNVELYQEVLVFLNRLELNMHLFTETVENSMKVNFRFVRNRLSRNIQDLRYAANLCKNASIAQDEMTITKDMKHELTQLLYPEEISETWEGWFARLYDLDNQISLFNFESYASLIHQVGKDEKKGFPGLTHFIFNKFNHIGICLIKDKQEDKEKLMLWTGSNFGEQYFKLDNNLHNNFENMKKKIMDRS
mmetsp:Transcript_11619/g.11949  ORF Transcript_11619/g.11949 Transcript_11619/m.11949 type:complete len:770 (+) Transcript_11619:1-2310(+)